MIRHLQIKNFKRWQDTGRINMAPLTVFFGANSSGKSSIGHLLLMLKQTMDNPDNKTTIFSGSSSSPIQFDGLQDVVHNRDKQKEIAFSYAWDLSKAQSIKDAKHQIEYNVDSVEFCASVGINESDTSEVRHLEYILKSENKQQFSIHMKRDSEKKSYGISTDRYNLVKTTGRAWPIGTPLKFYGFPETVVAYHQNADFVKTLNLLHSQLFEKLAYLGPMRSSPDRHYQWPGSAPDNVGKTGENTISAILAADERKINMGKKKRMQPFQAVIADELKKMGLIDDFKVRKIVEDRQTYEVKVKSNGSSTPVDLPDVGFGVSQVLPVLVQLFYAPEDSIILMEQPEIHLHPRAQAILADVMIDAIKACENGRERGIQLIIETHSEHFLRRLQRRIAEGIITNDQFAAYFADTNNGEAQLQKLQVDEYGSIRNWPENFFGDEMGDITAQSLAAMKKRAKESSGE